MLKTYLKKAGKVAFIIPFFIGFFGLMELGEGNVLDCAYKTVQLYVLEFSIETAPLNLATEIARWLCPIATAAAIITLLYSLIENIRIWWLLKTTDLIAVHGDSVNIDLVMKRLGKKAVHSEKPIVFRASRHLLMFNDDMDMYHFLDVFGNEFFSDNRRKMLFLCSEKIQRGNNENGQLVVCNVAENCARNYWADYPILKKMERILIIGFDNYGQNILTQGIMKNVISCDSQIEYHVIGDYRQYLAIHHKMNKAIHVKIVNESGELQEYQPYEKICTNRDTVIFYDINWYDVLKRDEGFDRVIIVHDEDSENIDILNELKIYYRNRDYFVKFTDERILRALWDVRKEKITPFGTKTELYDPEIILKEKLLFKAKMIHARYFAKHICDHEGCVNKKDGCVCSLKVCAECDVLLKDWNNMNTFTRYSNVAQADHIMEKLRLLLGNDVNVEEKGIGVKAVASYRNLDDRTKHGLWNLEHIRWNRYHFMNNWDYASKRDKEKHLHPLLCSFDEIPLSEQEKDEDAYLALEDLFN